MEVTDHLVWATTMAALSDLFSSPFKNHFQASEKEDPPSVFIQQESPTMSGGSGDTFSEPFTLISSTAESLGAAAADRASSRGFMGHLNSGKDWIAAKHSKVQPWAEFFNPKNFSIPRGAGEVTSRLVSNLQRYQTNYLFVFLVLVIYCM